MQPLPAAWGSLYELTKLSDAAFNEAVASGAIHPKKARAQARTVRIDSTEEVLRIAAPYYTTDDAKPTTVVSPTYKTANDEDVSDVPMRLVASATQPEPTDLPPPEQLVGDLAMAVERGDVRPDTIFKGRVQAVTDRLLILIADDDRGALN